MPYGDKEYEEFMNRVMGDATQIGIAISELMAGRKKRILGILSGMSEAKKERYGLTALAISANCEIMRETYFKEIFGTAKRIMKRHHKLGNYTKRDITRAKLHPFMRACQIVISMEEISYGVTDTFFKYFEVLTTMGLKPPQRKEGDEAQGPGWLAVDADRLTDAQRAAYAARDRAQRAGIIDGSGKVKITVADVFKSSSEDIKIDDFIDSDDDKSNNRTHDRRRAQTEQSKQDTESTDAKNENGNEEDELDVEFFEPGEDTGTNGDD